jgi:hypothetical protein
MAKILSSMTTVAAKLRRVRMLGISVHLFVLGSYLSPFGLRSYLSPLHIPALASPPAYKYISHHVALYKYVLPNELVLTAVSSVLLHNLSLAQLVTKFLAVNGTTKWIFYCVHKTQPFGSSHIPFLKSSLILSSHLHLYIRSFPFHHVSLYISYCTHLILRNFAVKICNSVYESSKWNILGRRDKFITIWDVNIHTRKESKDKIAVVKYFFHTYVRMVILV